MKSSPSSAPTHSSRNFEIKGPADRVLIYGILYISEILSKIKPNLSRRDAEKAVMNVALDTNFAIPGDAGFPLNQAFEPPRDRNESREAQAIPHADEARARDEVDQPGVLR